MILFLNPPSRFIESVFVYSVYVGVLSVCNVDFEVLAVLRLVLGVRVGCGAYLASYLCLDIWWTMTASCLLLVAVGTLLCCLWERIL